MENNQNISSLEIEIEKVIKDKNVLLEKSVKEQTSFNKVSSILTPIVIFLLLVIIPLFNILEIKLEDLGEIIFGLSVSFFLIWFWCKLFRLLLLSGNMVAPWTLRFLKKAREVNDFTDSKKHKKSINIPMVVIFFTMGWMCLLNPDNIIGMGLSLSFGSVFMFLSLLGVIEHMIIKKPERILFLLKHNRGMNILSSIIISLFCFGFIFAFFMDKII